MQIIKRNGTKESFNIRKIASAVKRALDETHTEYSPPYPMEFAKAIEAYFVAQGKKELSIDEIQDQTELFLISDFPQAGKAYLLYRKDRENLWKYGWDMTDLQRDIYESKYRYKKETFKEFVERVAINNRPIQKAILEKKFIPAGRILAGRGLHEKGRKLSYFNCFYPGTKVLTKSGYKPIEQIQKGEYVLTGDGTYQKVNETMVSDFSGELIVFDKSYTNNTIKTTPNHKFLTQKGWKTAEEIYIHNNKGKKKQYYGFLVKEEEEEEKYCLLGKPTKEKYVGPVYNLSVENNHEYYVEGILAHNCYVVEPPEDNIESIWDAAKHMARTFSAGGGCGTDLSKLRPKNALVNNAAQTTSGAVSFMDLYSLTTGLIGQSGRRGALMLTLSSRHPDIEEFIKVKNDLEKVTFANISVRVDSELIELAKKPFGPMVDLLYRPNQQTSEYEGALYTLRFKVDATGEIIEKKVGAKYLISLIAANIWNMAEPGLAFWDRIENWHLKSEYDDFEFASTNPCGR